MVIGEGSISPRRCGTDALGAGTCVHQLLPPWFNHQFRPGLEPLQCVGGQSGDRVHQHGVKAVVAAGWAVDDAAARGLPTVSTIACSKARVSARLCWPLAGMSEHFPGVNTWVHISATAIGFPAEPPPRGFRLEGNALSCSGRSGCRPGEHDQQYPHGLEREYQCR